MKRQNGSNQSIQAKAKGRALIFGIFGFMVWTGTSVPMILGFSEFMLLLKTLLPAVGILIIIGIITIMPGYFVTQSQDTISTTDALSPYMGPASSSQNAAKVSAGSPSSAYMRGRSLYVVNPSSTPNDSPTPFGPSRGITKTNENTPQNSVVNINESNDSVPTFLTNAKLRENSTSDTIQSTSSYTPGYRGSSGIFPPQGNNQAALAPAIVGEIGPNPGTVNPTSTLPLIKRSILKWPLKSEKQSIRNLPISNPIYLDEKENDFESFVRMPTVELEQAIFNERQRRDAQAAKSNILSDASTRNSLTILRANLEPTTEINPANLKTTNIIVKSSSNEDKEIIFSASQIDEVVTASEINVNKDTKIASILTPYSPSYYAKKIPDYSYETSRATSILASPIPDELRRRSPMQKTNMKSPAKSTLILSPNRITPPILDSQRLQQQEISVMKAENAMGSERIMLVNEIVYDRPDIVNNILKSVSGENSNILRGYPNMLEGNSDLLGPNKLDIEKPIYCTIKDEPELLPSVIDRPRPIQRRISRIISSGRRRSKSLGIIKSRATMTEAGTITLDPLPLPPPLPTRAANLKRLLQGDTSNMVHEEERLKYLFPAPPENQRLVNKLRRNLSLPNLAQMPSYKSLHNDIVSPDKPPNESMILDRLQNTSQSIDRDSEATSQMVSKISKKSSGVEDFGIFVSEKFDLTPRAPNSLNILAISTEQQSTYNANLHNYQSSSNQTPNEDDTIDWDWLAELDPYETPVKKQSLTVNKSSVVNNMETQALNFDANSKDHEIVTVMLKTPVNDNDEGRRNQPPAIMFMPEENSRSISVNQKDKKSSSMKINQKVRRKLSEARDSWYCRIGERMPSFSGKRNEVFQTNKIPPPLILDRSKVEPIPEVRYSEPTPPYYPHESTNRALESQLSRMEEQEQNSIELLNEKIPINNAEIPLLESLEKEMEEQSNQWQNLQNNLDRESFISAISQLPTDSPRDSQKLITLGKINDTCKHRVSNLSAISNNSDNISTDTWKKQLTEAQISYTNLYKQRSSYFKFSNFQISSPTPPESLNSETENNFESEDHNETPRPIRASISGNKNLLWRPAFPSNNNTSNIMWKPSNHSSANKDIIPPAADLRPPKRYTEQSLSIKSHSLWSKKAKNSNKNRSVSSWLSQTEIQPNYQNSEKMLNNFEPSDNIVDSYGKENSFYSKLDDGYENMESLEDMEEIGDFNQYEEKFNESTLLTIAALLKTDNIPSDKSLLPLRQEIYSGTLIDDFPSQEFFPQDSVLPLTINQNFSTSQINNFQMYNLPTPTNIDYQGRESNNQFLEARESPKKISYIDALEEVSKSALWTLEFPSDITIQSIGLQQPSTETWSVLTSMSQDFLRIKPRKLSNILPRFDTQSLWTKPTYKSKVKETGTTWKSFHAVSTKENSSTNLSLISEEKNVNKQVDHQMLWTPKNLSNNTIQSVGLQQPSAETWSVLTSMSQDFLRIKPRKLSNNLPRFDTQSLWTKPTYKSKVKETGTTWKSFHAVSTKEDSSTNLSLISEEKNVNKQVDHQMLWTPKNLSNNTIQSVGLQQPSTETWSVLTSMSQDFLRIKPRKFSNILPRFDTQSLWTKPTYKSKVKETGTTWKSFHAVSTKENSSTNLSLISEEKNVNKQVDHQMLWTPKNLSNNTIQSVGLQQPSAETWSVLTSMSQDFLRIKPRKLSNNLPRFDTQSLWTKPTYKSKVKETGTTWKSFHAVSTKEDSSTNLSLISEEKNVNKQVDHQMLWTPKNLSNNTIQSVGLQQPSAETWSALTSTSQGNYRNKLRKFDMKIIKFREESLWTKSQHKIKVQENIRLWIKFENFETKNANNFKLIANANEETVESKVWNAKTFKNIIDRSVGLQQPSPEVWKSLKEFSEVVPLSSSRKIGSNLLDSGKNSLQTFKITYTKLWSHSEKQVKEINWISRSCVTQDQKQESKPKSESKTNGYLWKKKSVVLKASFLGIDSSATFQPPSYPTEATLDGNTSTYRPKFVRLPLDQITSTKLWEKSINIPIQRNWISESLVRPESPTFSTSSSVPTSSLVSSSTISNASYALLWNQRTSKNTIVRSVGLQQPSPEVWKSLKEFSEVVPLSSSRKIGSNLLDSGKNSLQTFKITYTKLWSHSEKQVKEINWISRSCVTQDQKQESKPKSESKTNGYLWKKKSVVLKTSFLGIDSSATFQPPSYPTEATLDGNTSTYRPKFVRLPLDQITSTKLWEKSINIPIQRDWISESSVRPESPTFSTSSSVPSSPNSDASSIFSISTKASSIWAVQEMPSRTAVPFVYPFISEVNPSELKLVQDSHRASKISNGPKLAKPTSLAAVLELNQQFSPKSQKKNDNQTPKHGAYPKKKSLKGVVSEEKDIALALSISKSTNPPTRTTATTPTDWKLALEEAILAGKSTNPPTRTTATTPADWKLALEEAILAGKSTSK